MIIKLTGTKSWETVQLVRTRKPEGALLKWEYAYQKDTASPITAYRKKLSNEISDFQLNSIMVRKSEYEGKPTRTYSLRITYGDKSHIVDLGGGMTAQSVVNSFISLKDMSEADRNASNLSVLFYNNKEWYPNASVRKGWEKLKWFLSNEDKNKYIQRDTAFGKELKNFDLLDAKIEELIGELNPTLPRWASMGGNNALDDEDDECDTNASPSTPDQSIPFMDTPVGDVEV